MKWIVLMSKRKLSPLMFSGPIIGLKGRYDYSLNIWKDGLLDVCCSAREVKHKKDELYRVIVGDPYWPETFSQWAEKKLAVGPQRAIRVSKKNMKKQSKKDLAKLLTYINDALIECLETVIYLEIDTRIQADLETFFFNNVTNKMDCLKIIERITAPTKKSENVMERIAYLKLLKRYKKTKSINASLAKDIKNHVREYGWVGMDVGHGQELTQDSLVKNLKRDVKKDPDKEIAAINKDYSDLIRTRQEIFEKYSAPRHIKTCADYISESTHIRTVRRYSMTKTDYYARSLYEEVARRLGLSLDTLNFLFLEEVLDALYKGAELEKLETKAKENKKCSVYHLARGKTQIISGRDAEDFLESNPTDEQEKGEGILHGRPVYLGKVKGTARVIRDVKELKKVKRGDVLIATQTPPSFIAALKKAGAVVVDEGGVTSHASILCRELKVPCIIGTKVAIKTFADGDQLLVNATEGVVTKI